MGLISKIILITSGQPSLNPRLVKEADSLIEAGYQVEVIYQYWNSWATILDEKLLSQKKWKATRIGGDPINEKITYWHTRIGLKVGRKLIKLFGFGGGLAELAIGRCTYQLIEKAKNTVGDIYIAHNLAALPAAVLAAKYNHAKSGFDAEDLHRYEMSSDDLNNDVRLKKYLEERYFPSVNYLTTSSPEITKKYEALFPFLKFKTLLNVFSSINVELAFKNNNQESLKLFWFSQNVGLFRGIQDVIGALKILEQEKIEFHILGFLSHDIKTELDQIINNLKFINAPKIIFHPPIDSTELINFASNFDVGLATELGFSINNDLALSNKIFTYAQAGLAIIASDTTAQKQFMITFPNMGTVYEKKNSTSLALIIKKYIEHKELLAKHQTQSAQIAKQELNWDVEKEKFLSIIHSTLNS